MTRPMTKRRTTTSREEIVPAQRVETPLSRWIERLEEFVSTDWPPIWPLLRLTDKAGLRVPPVDVYEDGGSLVVKTELPGMKKEEIEVRISGNALTISGKKEKDETVATADYQRVERAAGLFRRTVTLPVEIEADKAIASYRDGVLEIRAPKVAGAEPSGRRIEVT